MVFIDHDLDAPSSVEHIQSHSEVDLGVSIHNNGNPLADSPFFDAIVSNDPPISSQITEHADDFEQQMPSTTVNDLDPEAAADDSDGNLSDLGNSASDDGDLGEGGNSSDDVDSGEDADSSDISGTRPSLFCLPFEIRFKIWKLVLPGRRVFRARARYGLVPRTWHTWPLEAPRIKLLSPDASRWIFRVARFEDEGDGLVHAGIVLPKILEICHESRNFALQHGGFAFVNSSYSEPGIWWNPELDVLFFNHDWDFDKDTWALQGLCGLKLIRNIAIHSDQAKYVCYNIGYRDDAEWAIRFCPRRREDDVLALKLFFRESGNAPHYIPEFFPCFKSLIIRFLDLHKTVTRHKHNIGALSWWDSVYTSFHWHEAEDCCTVTLNVGEDIRKARKELARYRKLCMTYKEERNPRGSAVNNSVEWSEIIRDGPVYALKDGVAINNISSWNGIGFEMCRDDDEECL